jgi:hypothetical protein
MKKRLYLSILVALSVLLFILQLQIAAYSGNNPCPDNLKLVKLGDQPIFCVLDRKRAEIIGRRLERIAEDNSIYNSFNTNYLVYTAQDAQKSRLNIEIPYLLITLKQNERIAVIKDDNSYNWEKPAYLIGDNQETNKQIILNDNKFNETLKLAMVKSQEQDNNSFSNWINNFDLNLSSNPLLYFFLHLLGYGLSFGIYLLWIKSKDWLINNRGIWTFGLTISLIISSLLLSRFFSNNLAAYTTFIIPIVLGTLGGFYGSLESLKTSKLDKALDYIRHWDSSDLQTHRKNLESFIDYIKNTQLPEPKSNWQNNILIRCNQCQKDVLETIRNFDDDKRFSLIVICNFWENLYLLLDNNLIDTQIIKNAFKDLYLTRFYTICYLGLGFDEESIEWDNSNLLNLNIVYQKESKMSKNLRALKNLLE